MAICGERDGPGFPDWIGRAGAIWRESQPYLDRMFAPVDEAALAVADPKPGEHVIDIGCGAGASTFQLAARVGSSGKVVGIDISETLLARARERLPSGLPVELCYGNASSHPLPRSSFDLLFSRFGVMFFDDPVAAFSHLRLTLRPSGRLLFVAWRSHAENEWIQVPMAAMADAVPRSVVEQPEATGTFSFADRDRVHKLLTEAGFTDIRLESLDRPLLLGEAKSREAAVDEALDLILRTGPLGQVLALHSRDRRVRVTEAVRATLGAQFFNGAITLGGAVWIVSARNTAMSDPAGTGEPA